MKHNPGRTVLALFVSETESRSSFSAATTVIGGVVSTILLPVIQAEEEILNTQVLLLFAERFLFIFSIAIQFDIRDMQADQRAGLKTIPLLIGQDKAIILSFLTLAASLFFSVFHYPNQNDWFILWALCISTAITYLFLKIHFFKNLTRYYYQVLDGALLLQGLLVLGFYFLNQY